MKYSVVIPAFKAKYLQECIDSILGQTYKDFELIIVNDASPQKLESIVNSYGDKRIRYYVNKKNSGMLNVVDNWNKCLEYAKGEYIICMGDDDKLLPNCLEEYDKLIEKYPKLGIYHGWTEIINAHSEISRMQETRPEYESLYSLIWHRWNGRIQFIGDFLFHTETLRKDGGFYKLPLAWYSDDMSAFIGAMHGGIANTQVPVFQYRQSSINISNTGNTAYKMDALIQYEDAIRKILDKIVDNNEKTSSIFYKMCLDDFAKVFIKKRVHEIKIDLIRNGIISGIYKWLRWQKKYKITKTLIGLAVIEAIKSKRFQKSYK